MSRCGLLYDPVYLDHLTGPGHPESPQRASRAYSEIRDAGLVKQTVAIEPKDCTEADLERVHTKEYLNIVRRNISLGLPQLSTGDTIVCEDSWSVACKATGGILHALDLIMTNSIDRAFCLTRPPGHHATPNKGMGFCIFNHVAVAARRAQAIHGVGKILIVDWDVHHGNGTQDIFYEDESVYFFSTHQSPWYPGTGNRDETGSGKGLGYTRNHPLPAGSGHSEIVENAFADDLAHRMDRFKPELVIISAGFDSRIGDPLGQFTLSDQDFQHLTQIICHIAQEYSNGNVLSVLEGGYSIEGLAHSCVSHLKSLL